MQDAGSAPIIVIFLSSRWHDHVHVISLCLFACSTTTVMNAEYDGFRGHFQYGFRVDNIRAATREYVYLQVCLDQR